MYATNIVRFAPRAVAPEHDLDVALTADFDAEALTIALVAAARESFGARYGLVRLVLVGELRRIAECIVLLRGAGRPASLARRVVRAQVQAAAGFVCLAAEMRLDDAQAGVGQAVRLLADPINRALGGRVVDEADL